MADRIYLDHNATAPACAAARDAIATALTHVGNPSSVHQHGRSGRRLIEAARDAIANLVGCAPTDVIFTSGGTEANVLALNGHSALVSRIEHESVLVNGGPNSPVEVTDAGVIDLDDLRAKLTAVPRPSLVSVMWANNETGVIQPISEVIEICRDHGVAVHCDAVQAVGRLPIDFASSGLTSMTVSAHKIGGPAGIGALILRAGAEVNPVMRGGGQEKGRRSGTENLLGIVGFGAAAAQADLSVWTPIQTLRDEMEARLLAIDPTARVHGAAVPRLANTSCVSMPDVAAETQVMSLDLAGISVSAGSACSSGKVKRSHVIDAMSPSEDWARTAIRISLCQDTNAADIDRMVAAWRDLRERTGRAVA